MNESQKDKLNQVKDKMIEIEVQTTRKVTYYFTFPRPLKYLLVPTTRPSTSQYVDDAPLGAADGSSDYEVSSSPPSPPPSPPPPAAVQWAEHAMEFGMAIGLSPQKSYGSNARISGQERLYRTVLDRLSHQNQDIH